MHFTRSIDGIFCHCLNEVDPSLGPTFLVLRNLFFEYSETHLATKVMDIFVEPPGLSSKFYCSYSFSVLYFLEVAEGRDGAGGMLVFTSL